MVSHSLPDGHRAQITMLTPYRAKGTPEMSGAGDSAMNWYSRRLARELISSGVGVSVVGPRHHNETRDPWEDDGIVVQPTFLRTSPLALLQALMRVLCNRSRIVHVQHELFAYGGLFNALALPVMLWLLRASGRRIVTTIHGVIPLSEISSEFVKANRVPGNANTARFLWRSLIRAVVRNSDVVHVNELVLRDVLVEQYDLPPNVIRVVPLGIESHVERPERDDARRSLDIAQDSEVILFFGYLAAYKGIEYLLEEIPSLLKLRPRLHVIIAGAVPARLKGHVQPEVVIRQLGESASRVHFLGFVPDAETAKVFAAADVLLLPYIIAMSSSGPLALSAGFDVPVLMSSSFAKLFPDAPGMFSLAPGAVTQAASKFFDDNAHRDKCQQFISRIREQRLWPKVATQISRIYSSLGST